MRETMMVEAVHLEKRYKDFHLKDLSFSLPAGYIMGFIGANGAGKTTALRLLLHTLRADGGEAKIFGLHHIAEERRVKEDIAVVFDWICLVEEWTVRQAARGLAPFYRHWDPDLFAEYCRRFGLAPTKKVKELSRGTQVKLSLALALSHGARLLILDEPTSGVDPMARDEILEILQEYIAAGDRSVLFSTHITSDLEKIADYITFLHRGRLLYTGTKDGLTEGFFLVKGGEPSLTPALAEKLIGCRRYRGGFEGLIRSGDRPLFARGFLTEPPTIEEIMVYVGKGGGV